MLLENELSAKIQLPQVSAIEELFTDILGDEIDVKVFAGKAPPPNEVTATFVDGDGALVGACLLNLALAACLGAALVRIPSGAALEAAAAKNLSGMLHDAMNEVLNIAAQLFRTTDIRHRIVLGEVYEPGQPVPADIAAQLKKPTETLKVEVNVPRYTKGILAFVTIG
jgi:hypothetical protein